MTSYYSSTFQFLELRRVAIEYPLLDLNIKEGYTHLALVNTRISSFGVLLF